VTVENSDLGSLVAARKAVIFDLFYTLTVLDSAGPARPKTPEILGVPADLWTQQLIATARDRFAGKFRDPVEITRRLAHAIDPAIPEARIREATAYRLERFRRALINIPEVSGRTIKTLRGRGKKIGLISNADVGEMAGWAESPIAGLFDSVVFSCDAGCVKPDREIYGLSLRELAVAPDESLFVGDGGSEELRGAREAGLASVMITGHISQMIPEKIAERREHADFMIDSLEELLGDKLRTS
jgi:putative hydrolase of the HAD superfamily